MKQIVLVVLSTGWLLMIEGSSTSSGQFRSDETRLSGQLAYDLGLFEPAGVADDDRHTLTGFRTIPGALALSAVVPGLGQAYNRQWMKAAAFLSIEAALWTGHFVWKNEGRAGEREFEAFAHQYWSPRRYAEWLNTYSGYPGSSIAVPEHIEFQQPETWSDNEWRQVLDFFEDIRAAENRSRYILTDAVFSHKLEDFGEQQYYEMIGKYFQYAPGWNDYDGADNPLEESPDGDLLHVSDRFFEYARMHGAANDLLRRASRTSAVILVNHVLSAVDAAVFAKIHNDRLMTSVTMSYDARGDVTPLAVVQFRF